MQGDHFINLQAAWHWRALSAMNIFWRVVFLHFQHDGHDATESLLHMQLCQTVLDDMDVGG